MAMQTSVTHHTPSSQVVGNAFVEQYYHILHQSPHMVYRFYTDSSVLSRPGADGNMDSVKTMKAINDVILSLDYKDNKAEIRTIDAQDSFMDGVVVLVTGWLTGKDSVKRKFTQSFFLAPQDKGYFVLNDVFRYLDEDSSPAPSAVQVNGITEKITSAPVTPDPEPFAEPTHIPANPTPAVEVVYGNGNVVHEPSDNGVVSVVEEQVVEAPVQPVQIEAPVQPVQIEAPVQSVQIEAPVEPIQIEPRSVEPIQIESRAVQPVQNEARPVTEPAATVQENTPKKSYASIVKVKLSTPVYVPTTTRRVVASNAGKAAAVTPAKVATVNTEQHSAPAPAPAPESSAPSSNNGAIDSSIPEEVEGHSIYIRGLDLQTSAKDVEEEFKKFGAIRPNGVQVRNNKQGFCFGFVEFVAFNSKKSALEATPVIIAGRQAHVEEKRTSTRVDRTGRPRFPLGRPAYRNDNFRGGRGNFGGRGYVRNNDMGSRGDYSNRRGLPSGRIGDGYQRVENNNGNGRGAAVSQTAVTA